jgi:hypothetical protein
MLNLSCCGGDLGFLIDTKKLKFVRGHPIIIPVQMRLNKISDFLEQFFFFFFLHISIWYFVNKISCCVDHLGLRAT